MRTRLRLGAAAIGLGALLLATVLASPALAWHSNVTVSARCLDGQVRIHYTVEAWEKQGIEATVDVSYKLNGEVTELPADDHSSTSTTSSPASSTCPLAPLARSASLPWPTGATARPRVTRAAPSSRRPTSARSSPRRRPTRRSSHPHQRPTRRSSRRRRLMRSRRPRPPRHPRPPGPRTPPRRRRRRDQHHRWRPVRPPATSSARCWLPGSPSGPAAPCSSWSAGFAAATTRQGFPDEGALTHGGPSRTRQPSAPLLRTDDRSMSDRPGSPNAPRPLRPGELQRPGLYVLGGEDLGGVDEPVGVALLGQEPLSALGVLGVAGVAADHRVEAGSPSALGRIRLRRWASSWRLPKVPET